MDLMDYRRKIIANSPHLMSASGAVASFSDGTDLPLKSLNVDIEPVQDLHGYEYPWVGGGGKNLIDSRLSVVQAVNTNGTWNNNVYTLNGLTFTVADDGHITINGTSTANTYFTVYRNSEGITLPSGSYVLHKSGSADIIVAAPKNGSYWTSATTNDSVVSLTESARVSYYVQIQNGKTISNYKLYPMFEAGTTATSWSPYENICPISGWNGVKVTRNGKNLLDLSNLRKGNFSGATNNTNVSFDEHQPIKGGQTYVWSSPLSDISGRYLRFYDINKTELSDRVNLYGTGAKTFSVPSNAQYFRCMWYRTTGIEPTDIVADQIELGSTATPYEPYNGVTIRSGGNLFNPHVYTGIAYNPTVGDTVTLTDSAVQFTDNGNGVFTVTTSSTWRYFNVIIPINPTKEYATKIAFSSTGQVGVTRGYLDADFKILTKFNSTDSPTSWEYSLIPEANAAYYYFVFTNRGTASATLTLTQPQFVEGATVGDYDPYTEAFYGGTLNPLTGVVTLDRQFFELDGNSNVTRGGGGSTQATEFKPYWASIYVPCKATKNYSAWRFSHGLCQSAAYGGIFRAYYANANTIQAVVGTDTLLSDNADVKAWLQAQKDAGTPLQIVAELATPFEIQLTPQQVRSLYGNDTIFADTGNIALEYWAHA